MQTQLWAIGLVIAAGIIGAFGPIYLKKGSSLIDKKKISTIYKNKPLILGVLIYGISTIMFIPALKGGELSVLYPLVGLVYVWVAIYSKFMLKEEMTPLKWVGILTIIIGVSLIGIFA
jgi:multidrug transporter EmrE-like cation transporter